MEFFYQFVDIQQHDSDHELSKSRTHSDDGILMNTATELLHTVDAKAGVGQENSSSLSLGPVGILAGKNEDDPSRVKAPLFAVESLRLVKDERQLRFDMGDGH
ncbi:hypothetical protein Nepgr_030095 [Nepenthes gracilis]|uniref:Uncharacterized protein n=1 Tax=Nepenthes gracilis TaxID=150966 RepID=A0AAD3TF56_NEPGR|nr:hypothetical protein Nepgr_030095 [Nepenthes gracilis]